jgi:hypothetical protein
MALLNDSLSVWEIGFRWANEDPLRTWIRIPLPVRDNFRVVMDAILQGHLYCSTLGLEKDSPIYAEAPEMSIRNWLDDVNAIIDGKAFNRKLLSWAVIDRWAMSDWCERRAIPLPQFWFPPGWNLDYKWPEPETARPADAPTDNAPAADEQPSRDADAGTEAHAAPTREESRPPSVDKESSEGKRTLDRRQRGKVACQEVARRLWAKQPTALKKTIAASHEVQEIAPGSEFELEVVERWLSEVDPRNLGSKRGPKRKQG